MAMSFKQLRMTPEERAELGRFAEERGLSVAEAIRTLAELYSTGTVAPAKKRAQEYVTFQFAIPEQDYKSFTRQVSKHGTTVTLALMQALRALKSQD